VGFSRARTNSSSGSGFLGIILSLSDSFSMSCESSGSFLIDSIDSRGVSGSKPNRFGVVVARPLRRGSIGGRWDLEDSEVEVALEGPEICTVTHSTRGRSVQAERARS
jgi:hypothetical protein